MSSVARPSMRAPPKRISPRGLHHAANRAQRSRLAGAVGAEQRRDRALLEDEVDAVQHPRRPVGGVQLGDFQQRRHQALVPKIGLHHLGVLLHLGRRSLRDLAPEVERDHLVGDAHHQAHVVLDQKHGDAQPVADVADQLAERVHFLVIEAARRLVQQQQLGLAGECARQLDALLRAEGKVGHALVGRRLQAEERDQLARLFGRDSLLARHPRQAQRIGKETAPGAAVAAQHHIVLDRHGAEQRQVLEGASDARCGDAVPGMASKGRPSNTICPLSQA